MKTILLTALFMLLSGCAGAALAPPPADAIGGQRRIDFSDPDQRYQAFVETAPSVPAVAIPPELQAGAKDQCLRLFGPGKEPVAVIPGPTVVCTSVPPLPEAVEALCPALGYAAGRIEGTVLVCEGPVQKSAAPKPEPAPGARPA